jgi:hypothetical protein
VVIQAEFTSDARHLITANGNRTIYVLRLAGPQANTLK